MRRRMLAVLLSGLVLVGCEDEPDLGDSSSVEGLRILGLSSSAQLVEPGDDITLDALWVDTRPDANDSVITAWFPGCINPDFGTLNACVGELNDLQRAAGSEWPSEFFPIPGSSTDVTVSEDLLAGRDEFGVQYFFFAACRGSRFEFSPSQHATIPLICRDAGGRTVAPPDFRAGFRTVTALTDLDDFESRPPAVTGFDVGGTFYEPHCTGTACSGYIEPDCDVFECPELVETNCDDNDDELSNDCDNGTPFRVLVDEDGIGIDYLTDSDELESVKVTASYFVSAGSVYRPEDLLHEREPVGESNRWDRESQSRLVGGGETFLWAVVYDSVGGASWAGIGVKVVAR